EPVGEPGAGRPARQDHGGPGTYQAQHIAQVVSGVRDQGHRIREVAETAFDDHENQVQSHRDRHSGVDAMNGYAVGMAMPAGMLVRRVVLAMPLRMLVLVLVLVGMVMRVAMAVLVLVLDRMTPLILPLHWPILPELPERPHGQGVGVKRHPGGRLTARDRSRRDGRRDGARGASGIYARRRRSAHH